MYYQIKGLPPIKLVDLLKKRKTNLKDFLKNVGIVSYQTMLTKCSKMGVAAPSEEEFFEALGGRMNYSSPQEGLVVLESPVAEEIPAVEEKSKDEGLTQNFVPSPPVEQKFEDINKEFVGFQKKKKKQQRVQSDHDDGIIEPNEPNEQVPG
jgi:hypothetical protein